MRLQREYKQCEECVCDKCNSACETGEENCAQCELIGPEAITECEEQE